MSELMVDDVAQRLYLSALLGNPGLFARVQHLVKPSYFDGSLQAAVTFMKGFYTEHRGVPSTPVFQAATKLKLEAQPLPDPDQRFVAEQIASFCQIRAITEAVLRAPAHMEKGTYGQMVNEIKLATQVQLHIDLGIEYFHEPHKRLDKMEEQAAAISTGWDSVDELIEGVRRQELVQFVANSGIGKSVVMLNMGRNLLRNGLNGVYITLEMRDDLVAQRLDSIISRISSREIRFNKLKVGEDIELARENGHGRFFIRRMRENTTTADHIISYLRELEAVHGFRPDFVIVDYLDLMGSVTNYKGENMFTKDKLVAEEVRAIGFDFDCLMISASQLGRGAIEATRKGDSIGQDHIQGGISKVNTADLIIAIVQDEAMKAAGEYVFQFLKARNSGATHRTVTMGWDEVGLRVEDLTTKLTVKGKPVKPLSVSMTDVVPGQSLGLNDLLST